MSRIALRSATKRTRQRKAASRISILLERRNDMSKSKTVAIIGAGPTGLAAAAHALERNLRPIVLEAGPKSAMPCASGRTCACFRRGATMSMPRRGACCRRPAGTLPIPITIPPAASSPSATSTRSPAAHS